MPRRRGLGSRWLIRKKPKPRSSSLFAMKAAGNSMQRGGQMDQRYRAIGRLEAQLDVAAGIFRFGDPHRQVDHVRDVRGAATAGADLDGAGARAAGVEADA